MSEIINIDDNEDEEKEKKEKTEENSTKTEYLTEIYKMIREILEIPTFTSKTLTIPPPTVIQGQCSICLEPMNNGTLNNGCNHAFCFDCIRSWLKINQSCPLCKFQITKITYEIESNTEYLECNIKNEGIPEKVTNLYRFRKEVYKKKIIPVDLYKEDSDDEDIKWIEITPKEWKREEVQNRLKPFIEREVKIILGNEDYYVCNYIYKELSKYDTLNKSLNHKLKKYLKHKTNTFINELEYFYNSMYKSVSDFDDNALYTYRK